MSKFCHASIAVGLLLAVLGLSGCGQKGALYLPDSSSKQMVSPTAKPVTDGINNAYDPTVNPNTQDPNIRLDNTATPVPNQATTSAIGGKNDY